MWNSTGVFVGVGARTGGRAGKKRYGREEKRRRRREDKDVEEEDAGAFGLGGSFIDIEQVNVSR